MSPWIHILLHTPRLDYCRLPGSRGQGGAEGGAVMQELGAKRCQMQEKKGKRKEDMTLHMHSNSGIIWQQFQTDLQSRKSLSAFYISTSRGCWWVFLATWQYSWASWPGDLYCLIQHLFFSLFFFFSIHPVLLPFSLPFLPFLLLWFGGEQ